MAEDDKGTGVAQDPGGAGGDGNGGDAGDAAAAGLPDQGPQREVLSLSQLIGAPIHALVDAEAHSAMATARFIRDVGFKPVEDGDLGDFGDLQMARFTTVQRREDGGTEPVEVQIPLLTLLPIPALQIQDASLEYTVKVIQTEALPQARKEALRGLGDGARLPVDPPATMRGTFAAEPRPGGRRSMDMLVKMKLRIEQADMPAGLARLLSLAGESVTRVPLSEAEEGQGETPEDKQQRGD